MREYELTVLFKSGKEQKETEGEVLKVVELLEKQGAKIIKKTDPAEKALVYEILKAKEAVFVRFEIELAAEKVFDLETKLRLMDNVVRYLLVKKE